MKIDKRVKELSKRLDSISYANSNADDESYGLCIHDDDYYLDIGSEPPRFAYYRHVRAEKWKALKHKPSEYDHSITQDELDYALKRDLRIPPETRYQHEKEDWYWHESRWYWRQRGNKGACVPECRFYHEYGRIEDEEVIEKHDKLVESLRQENAIVEPPPQSEMLMLAKIHRFS